MLVWNLHKSHCGQLSLAFSILHLVVLRNYILNDLSHLECKHGQTQNLFLTWIKGESLINKLNESRWIILASKINFEDEKVSSILFTLLEVREIKCHGFIAGAGLKCCPGSARVSWILILIVKWTIRVNSSVNRLVCWLVSIIDAMNFQIFKHKRKITL